MSDKENLFTEFPDASKEKWLEKVTAELKTKQIESLYWKLEDIELTPFYEKADLENRDQAMVSSPSNNWKIGEDISSGDAKSMNAQALEALANGVDAPCFILAENAPLAAVDQILKTIRLDFVEASFILQGTQDAAKFGEHFLNYLKEQEVRTKELKGGIFTQETSADAQWVLTMNEHLPQFRFLSVRLQSSEQLTDDLAQSVWKASQHLSEYQHLGLSIDRINSLLQFSVDIGKNYFVEIAKIRALKLLWANILKAFGANDVYHIYLEARLAENSQLEDTHQNMISATTQSMSAVLAGVDCLNVLPADHYSGTTKPFTKRIARNIQHLLKMESYLDKVADPAAGSYYLEELTQRLTQKAWKKFLALEKESTKN